MLRLRAIAERARGSLFFVPALFIVAALAVAWLAHRLDTGGSDLDGIPFLLSSTPDNARTLLATVAGATITVAGIVFSVTVVAVQLTSSQFSPRALRGYLRDRFHQYVIGLVVGTFTYALVALAVVPDTEGPATKSVTVTAGLALGVLAALAIVAFLDRGTRSLQVSAIIRRISDETLRLAGTLHVPGRRPALTHEEEPLPEAAPITIPSATRGWIQQIDEARLFRAIPQGALARLDVRIGEFIAKGDPLLTVWTDRPRRDMARRVNGAFAVGRIRTMQQDVPFGIGQLVDIAVRALSPGINDPTTAIEATVEIGAVLGEILTGDLPPRIVAGPQGRKLYRPHDPDRGAYIKGAFSQIRLAGPSHPAVMETLMWQLGRLSELLVAHQLPLLIEPLRREARLAVIAMRATPLPREDVEPIERLAVRLGLLTEEELLPPAAEDEAEEISEPAETPSTPDGEEGGTGGAEPGPVPEPLARAAERQDPQPPA